MKRVRVKFFNAHELEYQSCKIGAADGETELRAKRKTRRIELSSRRRSVTIQPSSVGTVRMGIKSAPCLLCTDVDVVSVARQRICFFHDWSS